MLIDITSFPIVWMKQAAVSAEAPADNPFTAFEALFAREEVFVLLSDAGLDQEQHEHTHEEKKQIALWMKRHKSELRTWVKASIHIEQSAAKRLAARAFTTVYEKFWGYPMLITASRDEALALARSLLAEA